jgi:lipid A 3-O-deacylase
MHGPGFLRGRGEAAIEILPFWLADYPKQVRHVYVSNEPGVLFAPFGPYRSYGASVTPVLYRWNLKPILIRNERPIVPWAQLGGGLLWTNHKFPILGGSTSVINFTPQAALGQSIFIRNNQSLDFAAKAVHISNASLGDSNPGLNVTLQFSVGYSWWK